MISRRVPVCVWAGLLATLFFCESIFAQYSPAGGVQRITPAEGLQVGLFASEPMIANPISVDVDSEGRVWITEGANYRKNVKVPPDNTIKVLEDTDGDGKADKSTVFTSDLNASMSICVAGDRIFVAESPHLYVYTDKNNDLKPDGPRQIFLTGFGGKNHDHGLHGLMLGPDHKLYMTVGDSGYDVTGPDGRQVKFQWGGLLRCELDGTGLEEIAVNFRNPWELSVDSRGHVWCSDNDNDGLRSVRICWILEGGNYGWFGRPEPIREVDGGFLPLHHWRIDQPGFVPYARITGFGSPSGMTCYEGNAFGDGLRGKILHCDPGPRELRVYSQESRDGLGFTCDQHNLLSSAEDNYFRPVDLSVAPDGALFVTDWYDGGVGGHNYNDPDRGRIYRVTPLGLKPDAMKRSGVLQSMPEALVAFKSPNLATSYLARDYLLKNVEQAIPELKGLANGDDALTQGRALWVLDRCGTNGRDILRELLKSKDPATRAQVIRIFRRHGSQYQKEILGLLSDRSPEVRTEVLLSLPGFDSTTRVTVWNRLADDYVGTDRMYLEALKIAARGIEEEIYQTQQLDQKKEWESKDIELVQILKPKEAVGILAVRLALDGVSEQEQNHLISGIKTSPEMNAGKAIIAHLARTKLSSVRRNLLDGLRQRLVPFWSELLPAEELLTGVERALQESESAQAALEMLLVTKVHTPAIRGRVVDLIEKDESSSEVKMYALRVAAEQRIAEASEPAYQLLKTQNEPLRTQAIRTLAALADARHLKELFQSEDLDPAVKQVALTDLANSAYGGVVLFRLVEMKQLPEALMQPAIRLGVENADINVRLLFGKYLPESDRPKRLGDQFTPEQILELKGDASRGERIFSQGGSASCNKCHRIRGKGTDIGPELTLIGKKYERRALLETIVNPSAGIAPEYYPYVVEMESGRVFGGFVVQNTEEQLVLKTIEGEILKLPRKEVVELVKQNLSLMPDAILKEISAQDAADLLEYLTTLR